MNAIWLEGLTPTKRRPRVYAFDPSFGAKLETAAVNELTIGIRWEGNRESGASLLSPGPVGDYVEVVDVDPASNVVYSPVNLGMPALLAQDGLPLSEDNPQFHQQMVYAVAMATIDVFERALGRMALWANHRTKTPDDKIRENFVRRLRLYPTRSANRTPTTRLPKKRSFLVTSRPARRRHPLARS